jgi:hypothetical protein
MRWFNGKIETLGRYGSVAFHFARPPNSLPRFSRVETIDILVNLDGEQNFFGENFCAFCMAAVLREYLHFSMKDF